MKGNDDLFKTLKTLSVLSGLGIYFVIVVGICIFLGHLFDEQFNAHPRGVFTGIILGFPIAIYMLYRRLKDFM